MSYYGPKMSKYEATPVAGVNNLEERFVQRSICDADIVVAALVILAILLALSK